jgi:hypothetical protein
VFTAPISIPKGISLAGSEAPLLSQDDLSTGTSILGGIDLGSGQGSGLLGDLRLPAPPAVPVRRTPEKVAPSTPIKPIHVSTGVQAAKLIARVNPIYPALAKQASGGDGAVDGDHRAGQDYPNLQVAAAITVDARRARSSEAVALYAVER